MPEDNNKFFDIGRPKRVGPPPTSKPVIVGHQPTIPDPMILEAREKAARPVNIPISNGTHEGPVNNPHPKPLKTPFTEPITVRAEPPEPLTDHAPTPPQWEPTPPVNQHPESVAAAPKPNNDSPVFGEQPVRRATEPQPYIEEPLTGEEPLPPTAKVAPPPDGPATGDELQVPAGHTAYQHKPRIWVWALLALILLTLIYAAIDAKSDVLPFHIFSHTKEQPTAQQPNSSQTNQLTNTQQALAAGFTHYQPTGTPITFAYPTAWGTPATTGDPGFSQRGAGKKADGVHVFLVNFATNKDVEIAITSSKYLPAARGTLYFDYLQWCIGTNDGKFYKQLLHFTTAAGVDTPSTITCDQGPLNVRNTPEDKLNSAVIVERKAKDVAGAVLGDVYTANLSDSSLPVLRVKDAKMTNGDDIKKLLGTIAGSTR